MFGISAFLLFAMLLLYAIGAIVGSVASLRRPRRPKHLFMAAFLILWSTIVSFWCFRNLHSRLFLQHLSPQSVAELRIGGRVVADEAAVRSLLAVLNSPRWYAENHPHYLDSTTLGITLNDGRQQFFVLSRLATLSGVVVRFCSDVTSSPPDLTCNYGGAYLPRFPIHLLRPWQKQPDPQRPDA